MVATISLSNTIERKQIEWNLELKETCSRCIKVYTNKYVVLNNFLYINLELFFQKDDVVCVDGDVAAILKTSRFSDDFTFQSADKKRCCSDANKPVSCVKQSCRCITGDHMVY